MKTFNEQIFRDLTASIIDQAKKMGATAVEVAADMDAGFSINVRKNSVETIEHNKGKNLGVTVYFGQRTGSATTSDLKPEAINIMLDKACHIARFTEEDPFAGLAEKELMAYDYLDVELDQYYPWPIKIKDAIEIAKNCEARGLSYSKYITNCEGASVSSNTSFGIYANSHDFYGVTATTRHSISCSYIAERDQEMQRDYYYTTARDALDLDNCDDVAIKAAEQTVNRLGAKKITTRNCPVIFSAQIAPSLINNFVKAIHGANLYRKSSFLLDHLQQPIFAEHINIEENPYIPKGLGSSAFDAEGVKLYRSDIITNGVLQRYVLDSYSARKLQLHTTGNAGGIHNLIVKTGNNDLKGLLKTMGEGLLVTELMGDGVNIVTGDYSRGIFGYWVENGEIQYPVTGVTIAGNLKNIFLGIQEIGNDVDRRGNILTGSILLNEMAIAGG